MKVAKGACAVFAGISRLELPAGRIKRYAAVFDRSMALAQVDFAPERLKQVSLEDASALKARPEVARHLKAKA